jgi:hypothetical protein
LADPFKALSWTLVCAVIYEGLTYFDEDSSDRQAARARLKACEHLRSPEAVAAYERETELHAAERDRVRLHSRLRVGARTPQQPHLALG